MNNQDNLSKIVAFYKFSRSALDAEISLKTFKMLLQHFRDLFM